jgi:hypothetical protein
MLGKHYCYEDHYSAIIVTCQVFVRDLFPNPHIFQYMEQIGAISFLARWRIDSPDCGFPLVVF